MIDSKLVLGKFHNSLKLKSLVNFFGGMSVLLAGAASAQTTVMVTEPEKSQLVQELQLPGTLNARYRAKLSVRVDGMVEQVMVDTGDRVSAGDTLIILDSSMEKIALQEAEAATAEAVAKYQEALRLVQEAQKLIDKHHISQTEFSSRKSGLAYAKAKLNVAKAAEATHHEKLKHHVVPAPFDGVIVNKMTEIGEWVNRGTPVFELVNPHEVLLDVQAPQEYFAALINNPVGVQVMLDAAPGQVLNGRIATRVPVSHGQARTFLIRIMASSAGQVLPGSSATALIRVTAKQDNVLFVPNDALLRQPDGQFSVFSVEQNGQKSIVRRRSVRIGQSGERQVEILNGLRGDELVVVRGNEILRDGETVNVIKLKKDESV